jgi:alpha-tubulin suppressor-like RCC1 family protein
MFFSPLNIKKVVAGASHCYYLLNSGDVYAVGQNEDGQLGTGNRSDTARMVKSKISNVMEIYSGANHSVAVLKNGDIYAVGKNSHNQLGVKSIYPDVLQSNWVSTKLNKNKNNINNIFLMHDRTYICLDDGKVFYCGRSHIDDDKDHNKGKLWKQSNLFNISKIAGGAEHTIAMDYNGKVYGIGSNLDFQLGLPQKKNFYDWSLMSYDSVKDVECGLNFTCFLEKNGELIIAGKEFSEKIFPDNKTGVPLIRSNIKNVIKIYCSNNNIYAISENENVYAMGDNENGQLGMGNRDKNNGWVKSNIRGAIYIITGKSNAYAINDNNDIYVVGANQYGQLITGLRLDCKKWEQVNQLI